MSVVVGVAGCSASGKSAAARRLAALLRSPAAVVAADLFFDAAECAARGTWEDAKCLNATECANAIKAARQRICSEKICEGESDAGDNDKKASESKSDAGDNDKKTSEGKGDAGDKTPSDDSLMAHEAEDARQQIISSALAAEHCAPAGPVQFIVCEGFLLFADPAICAVVDYFVFIDVDEETACIRRFLRAPRRHSRAEGFAARIEKMRLHRKPFPPPQPRVPGDYEGFWRRAEYAKENDQEKKKEENGENDTSWLDLADPARVSRALQGSSEQSDEGVRVPQSYYEFRYWFYYEVLYHYRRQRKLMEENVAAAVSMKKKPGSRPVWHIANGAEVSLEAFEESLRSFAKWIRKECGDCSE